MSEGVKSFAARLRKKGKDKRKREKLGLEDPEEEEEAPPAQAPATVDASGLLVNHSVEQIAAGTEVIMTLKDTKMFDRDGNVLDEEDVLECADLTAAEKRTFNKKLAKGIDKYDEEQEQSVLAKYDEANMEFEKSRQTFRLEDGGKLDTGRIAREELDQLDAQAKAEGKTRYSFEEDPAKFTWSTLQNDTFTNEEMGAFKRPKKRRLVKKKKASFEEIEAALQDSTAATDPTPTTTTTTQRDPTLEDEDVTEALAQLARIASHEAKQVSERTNREAEMAAIVAEKEEKVELAEGEVTLKQLSNFANKVRAAQDEVGAKEEEEGEKKKKAVVEAVIDDSRKERLRNVLQDETTTRSLGGTLDIIAKQGLLQDNYAGRAGDTTIDNDDDGEIIRRTNKYGQKMSQEQAYRDLCHQYHGKEPSKKSQEKEAKRWAERQAAMHSAGNDKAMEAAAGVRRAQEASGAAVSSGSAIRKTLLSVGDKKRSHSSIETQLEESIAKRRKTG